MNKITQKPELNIQYINLTKAETDSFRHQMIMKTSQLLTKQLLTSNIDINPPVEDNSQQKSIFIKKEALQRTLSVYQWRHKTCYPVIKPTKLIVKSFTGNIRQKRTLCKKNSQSPFQIWNLNQSIYQLLITTQKIHHRLSEVGHLSLPQLFYLMKQILVGFECLIDIFGIFQPTEEMIAVNEHNEWRFWISEDFACNSKKQSNTTEAEFILKIIKMVETRLPNSKVGQKFFQQLKNLPVRSFTFLNLLDMTNIFISFNKIMVAKKFVSPNGKNNQSLYGSKNQSYFKLNRTYNELKDTPKTLNDRTLTNHHIAHFQHNYSPKQNIAGICKANTMKNLNDRTYNRMQSINLNMSRQTENKKQKQLKSHLKISEFYCAETLTKNNIQKRASFLFNYGQLHRDKQKQDSNKHKLLNSQTPYHSQSPVSPNHDSIKHFRTQTNFEQTIKLRPTSPTSPKQRKFSFQNPIKTEPNLSKLIHPTQSMTLNIPNPPTSPKQRKNSYYNYEKPTNKQAFSQSPNKSSSKKIFFDDQRKINKEKQVYKIHTKRQNILMNQQTINRTRKYSQHAPRIKSLDEFAKRNKKMFQSSTMQVVQVQKQVKYCNLKNKDIACHTRHATISGMAFGQQPLKKNQNTGFNNINNDLYNGKFEEIMKSIKSRSNGDKNEDRDQLNDLSPTSRKRRVTLFDKIREVPQRKISQEFQVQPHRQQIYSPFSGGNYQSPKPIIRVSNANNQTAQTLNKSELNLAKGSQQSNSLSNNNNASNIRQSDTNSNQKLHPTSRKGFIGQSNMSAISSKTYQPVKQIHNKTAQAERQKHMANSQDCFNGNHNNHYESQQSSQQFLKSNNWNKKISGLFSEVASIKMLKESSHFGDEYQFFEKDHLKDVKLQKLDKFGKQLKGSIIQTQQGHYVLNVPTRGKHNKSFSLIGEVKQEPYENDPSYLQYSTSMICQSRNMEANRLELPDVEKNVKNCESFEEQMLGHDEVYNNGGFNFSTELYKLSSNNNNL